jgi:WD40 repeat protein
VVSCEDGIVEIWNTARGTLDQELQIPLDLGQGAVTALALAAHGQLLATQAKSGRIFLWETITGKLAHTLEDSYSPARSLAFSGNSCSLVSGHDDGTALVWNLLGGVAPVLSNDPNRLWDLLEGDAPQAYPVLWAMVRDPERTVAYWTSACNRPLK